MWAITKIASVRWQITYSFYEITYNLTCIAFVASRSINNGCQELCWFARWPFHGGAVLRFLRNLAEVVAWPCRFALVPQRIFCLARFCHDRLFVSVSWRSPYGHFQRICILKENLWTLSEYFSKTFISGHFVLMSETNYIYTYVWQEEKNIYSEIFREVVEAVLHFHCSFDLSSESWKKPWPFWHLSIHLNVYWLLWTVCVLVFDFHSSSNVDLFASLFARIIRLSSWRCSSTACRYVHKNSTNSCRISFTTHFRALNKRRMSMIAYMKTRKRYLHKIVQWPNHEGFCTVWLDIPRWYLQQMSTLQEWSWCKRDMFCRYRGSKRCLGIPCWSNVRIQMYFPIFGNILKEVESRLHILMSFQC